ncbi:MAG TPA: ComEC/Rec2 family competence protein [Roseiflexaceae bacterium]|nr:ComEC/Rec2 family competence protein [Roseiflexaceae bacterium]
MPLIVCAVAWMVGIILADLMRPDSPIAPLIALGSLLLAWLMPAGRVRLAVVACCCMALGGWRFDAALVPPSSQHIARLHGGAPLVLVGVVSADPQRSAERQRLVVAAEQLMIGGQVRQTEGVGQGTLPPYPARSYGDRLELHGKLTTPREASRPGAFDYRVYLERKQIYVLMEPEQVRLHSIGHGQQLLGALLGLREQARLVLLRMLPEPQASLAIGILLGLVASIPDDVNEHFSITGTSHIIVISGWNITIIATALYGLAERMRLTKQHAFWAILVAIWIYTAFVGMTATVIRAAVMGTVVVVGQRPDRPAHARTTLSGACWAMTPWDPQTLWDMGFQLSALATASLFAYGKGTEALLLRTPLRFGWLDWAREALTATLAAQILALPLILYHFGNLSLIAPLANVLILPMVPYAMLFGAIALVGGLIWLPLGQMLAWPAYLFLAWLTEGARFFAGVPWAAVLVPPFPLWGLLAYYALVVGAWGMMQREPAQ